MKEKKLFVGKDRKNAEMSMNQYLRGIPDNSVDFMQVREYRHDDFVELEVELVSY